MVISGTSKIKTVYGIGFIASVALLPWSHHWCANAVTVTCFLGLLTNSPATKLVSIKNNRSVFVFITLYILYVIGLFYSSERVEGLLGLEQKVFLIGLPVIAATSAQLSSQQIRFVFLAFIISNLALTLADIGLAVASFVQGNNTIHNFDVYNQTHFLNAGYANEMWARFGYIALSNRIIDPTYFSIYLVFSIAVLLFFETGLSRTLKGIMLLWFSFFVLMLASRIGIILLGILLVSTILLKMKSSKIKVLMASFLTLGLLSGIIFLLPVTHYRMIEEPFSTSIRLPVDPTQWNSTNLRLLEWESGINGIKDAGPFGTGTGATWPVLQQYSSQHKMGVFSGIFNVHNQYLETFLEIGIAGFVGLLACYVTPLLRAVRTKNYLLLSLSLIVCLSSLTESILERANGLIFFTTFVSILMYSNPYDTTT